MKPILALVCTVAACAESKPLPPGVIRVPVVFSEGHDTDPIDHGRPVVLIARALGVKPEVFREAFSHVHPARAGESPQPEQVRQNKAALMSALGKYGITNDRLDEVSNYYRYVRSRGEQWPTYPAAANALVKDGVITGFELLDGGAGYTTPPIASVPGVKGAAPKIELSFSKNLETNGAISTITMSK